MFEVVILAAGEGKRMNSARPKVLQPVGGRPMLAHLIDSVRELHPSAIHVVIGAGAEEVRSSLGTDDLEWVIQSERLGTGHAALQALPGIDPAARVLILPGDMPLIRPATVRRLLDAEAELALLSFLPEEPDGYGRILRDDGGAVLAIREQRDASESERRVREVNSGVLCGTAGLLGSWLEGLRADNAQGEYYLTDCVSAAVSDGHKVAAIVADDPGELLGANDRAQLAVLEQVFQQRARQALFDQGVTLPAPETVQVRGTVTSGRDVVIDAGVVLSGGIELGDDVNIAAGCVLSDVRLAAGTRVEPYCVLEDVTTHGPCTIGPFARLRPGTELDEGVRIGNFVETKNARFGRGAKANHLTYAGDVEIGAGANVGAGTITCNYDGANKHMTIIGEGAFIGSNSALVAPVRIGSGATVGAGSVISSDAPDGRLTVARARQKTIEGWQRPRKKP